jgi:hypothetical protein
MGNFTLFRKLAIAVILLCTAAKDVSSQSVTSSPSNFIRPISPNSVTITLTRSNGDWPGSGNYTWNVSSTTGISSPASWPQSLGSGSGNANLNVTFTSAASGTYTFTVSRGGTSRSVVVSVGNLAAATSSGDSVSVYSVSNGTANFGPRGVFDPFPGSSTRTAALGLDLNGYYYFMPNNNAGTQNGNVTVYAVPSNGSGAPVAIASADINGASNNELGFVRLGIRQNGVGYLLAGDGSQLYLASFPANGTAATSITVLNTNVTIAGGGSASDFQNGDLCFSGNNTLFALANDGNGVTSIYTMPNGNTTTLTKKFSLIDNTNAPFTGQVNGVAFDILGSLYISCTGTDAGLYYINQATVNGPAGTINCALVQSGGGLTDLASNFFPNTIILPVTLESFTATKSGDNAILEWSTAAEFNNNKFEIERSLDGVNFAVIDDVAGHGTSYARKSYQYTDPIGTVNAKIIYYRLRNVDVDGKSYYSKIVAVRLSGKLENLSIFPNPFVNTIKLQINSQGNDNITIRLRNSGGQAVYSQAQRVQTGDNIIVLSDLEAIKPGLYLVEIVTSDGTEVRKILKQ